jgi:FixJ family two-component response regulator
LLTDVVMPEMTGPELGKRLRTAGLIDRVLFMSGYPQRHLDGGNSSLIDKPFTRDELLDAVETALGARS